MRPVLIAFSLLALCAAAGIEAVTPPPSPPRAPEGHLVLQIEGDARSLRVTSITPKPDPCGPVHRLTSAYSIAVLARDGRELGRYPLDLSIFDLDPQRVGGELRVEGCRVLDPRVATLASIPNWPDADRLELRHDEQTLGDVDQAGMRRLQAGRSGR